MPETPEQRSRIMRAVHSRDTAPELAVRQILRALGLTGYRLHRTDIPGKPDIAFVGRKRAIFVHGCFWHGHSCPRGSRSPKANSEYWQKKIARNRQRDGEHLAALSERGWSVLVIWECELNDEPAIKQRLLQFTTACVLGPKM